MPLSRMPTLTIMQLGRFSSGLCPFLDHNGSSDMTRFDSMSLMEHLGRERSFHLCLAPECSYGQYHDRTNGNILQCDDCGFRQCTVHNVGFHNGETCEQYDTRTQAQSTALAGDQTYVKSRFIPCPKCKVSIVKAGGCDHMTCKFFADTAA